MGQATADIAKRRTEANFVGMEVHTPGVGKLLSLVEQENLDNIRVYHGDALAFMAEHIAPESVHGIHIFFPDPWPKKRHHKRRIINPENIAFFTRKLATNGYIYFITDWEEYAESAKAIFEAESDLVNKYGSLWAETQEWRQSTKFELRAAKEGRLVRELFYVKRVVKPSAER
jgi:tRNA (guanine-N7-)-methyltransferase